MTSMIRAAVAAALTLAFLVGCSGPPEEALLEASWTKDWNTFDEVLEDSTVVVVAEASRQRTIDPEGISSTLTTFDVQDSIGAIQNTIQVRSTDGLPAGEAAEYDEGATYILFLMPFELAPGVPAGEYITVGQVAAFQVDVAELTFETRTQELRGEVATRITTRGDLPATIPLDELLGTAAQLER